MKFKCPRMFASPACPPAHLPLMFLVMFARFYWILRGPVVWRHPFCKLSPASTTWNDSYCVGCVDWWYSACLPHAVLCSSPAPPQKFNNLLDIFSLMALFPQCLPVCFIIFSLILGCWHRVRDKQQSMHGVCPEKVSHLMSLKGCSSNQKNHPCDICGLFLKGVLHLTAPFVQKLYNTSSCASLPHKHHTAENPLKRDVNRT
jgi:hypothetical protein